MDPSIISTSKIHTVTSPHIPPCAGIFYILETSVAVRRISTYLELPDSSHHQKKLPGQGQGQKQPQQLQGFALKAPIIPTQGEAPQSVQVPQEGLALAASSVRPSVLLHRGSLRVSNLSCSWKQPQGGSIITHQDTDLGKTSSCTSEEPTLKAFVGQATDKDASSVEDTPEEPGPGASERSSDTVLLEQLTQRTLRRRAYHEPEPRGSAGSSGVITSQAGGLTADGAALCGVGLSLGGVSFELQPGELLGVVGASGR